MTERLSLFASMNVLQHKIQPSLSDPLLQLTSAKQRLTADSLRYSSKLFADPSLAASALASGLASTIRTGRSSWSVPMMVGSVLERGREVSLVIVFWSSDS